MNEGVAVYTVPVAQHTDPGWRFVWLWMLTLVALQGLQFLRIFPPSLLFFAGVIAQWLLLRAYVRSAGWWVVASYLGVILVGFIHCPPGIDCPPGINLLTHGWDRALLQVIGALIVVGPQFLVLRRSIPQAGWWIVLGFTVSLIATFLESLVSTFFLIPAPYAQPYRVLINAGFGLIQGLGLRLLLAATPQSHQQLRRLLVALGLIGVLAAIIT